MATRIELLDVTVDNWRDCADLEVTAEQQAFVSSVARYLCLCHYGGVWRPLAVAADGRIVGFVMWAVDPDDRSGWIGGLSIGREHQRRGYGRAAVLALLERLRREQGCASAALATRPAIPPPARCTPRSASPRPASARTTKSSRDSPCPPPERRTAGELAIDVARESREPTPRFPAPGFRGILSVRVRT